MKKSKRIMTLLLALIVTLAFMPAAVYADGSSSQDDNGLVLDKTVNKAGDTITMESYVTGKADVTARTKPVHIVLVLDTSGSMSDSISDGSYAEYTGKFSYNTVTSNSYYYKWTDGNYYRVHGIRNRTSTSKPWQTWMYFEVGSTRYYLKGSGDAIQAQSTDYPTYNGSTGTYPKDLDGNNIGSVYHKISKSAIAIIWSGTLYTPDGENTKLDALKNAANAFVAAVAADAAENNLEHQISIVQSADTVSTVAELTSVNNDSNVSLLETGINSLSANGDNFIDLGIDKAYYILADDSGDADKAVIVFTDGSPAHESVDDEWSNDGGACAVADIAIGGTDGGYGYADRKSTHDIKSMGAAVWTVGLFPDGVTDIQSRFMNYMSSNYPDAVSLSNGGTQADTKYFMNSGTSEELKSVFNTIFNAIYGETVNGGAAITDLGTDAVVQDRMSEYFDLNVTDTNKVKVYTEDYKGDDTWGDKVEVTDKVKVEVDKDTGTVKVSGFDFSANWCGTVTENGTASYRGKKLIIEVPVKENGTGAGDVLTNDADESAVYKGDGTKVEEFPVPSWYIPYFEVKYGNAEKIRETKQIRIDSVTSVYDAAAAVAKGYLYGGLYTDDSYDEPYTYECGKALNPDNKDVFYVKEVSNKYLQPKQLTLEAQNKIQSTYFLTAVDTADFREVGFEVTDGTSTFTKIAGSGAAQLSVLADGESETDKCAVANEVTAKLANGQTVTINMENMIGSGYSGYVAAAGITYNNDKAGIDAKNKTIGAGSYTILPYWVTPDGVKVTGVQKRTLQYTNGSLDADSLTDTTETKGNNPKTTETRTVDSVTSVYAAPAQTSLLLVNTMTVAGTLDTPEKAVTVTAPGKVTLKSVKAGKKSLSVSWKKVKNAKGYQIKYKKSGTDTWKYVYVKSSVTSKKISKLAAGKKYTVKVRAYRTYTNEAGKTCKKYGSCSSAKTVKTLK